MYETLRNKNGNGFDCLQYITTDDQESQGIKMDVHIENIRFCRQSTIIIKDDLLSMNGEHWTFDYLRQINISGQQLFDWYAPIDVIEEYLLGKQGVFVNCSGKDNLWFGSRCQYTLDSSDSLNNILWDRFDAKDYFQGDISTVTNGTCYLTPYWECQSILCLDWREICDGKIDCTNGFDERYCDELERNECDPTTEYRCLNGQCIDKSFYRDQYPDCMDYSDERFGLPEECFYKFYALCEDRSCPYMWFSCGDGYCYDGPNINNKKSCRSQRDHLYIKQMPLSTFIFYSHISLIYNDTKPELICYNESLCPYLSKKDYPLLKILSFNGSTCRTFDNQTYETYSDMIEDIKHLVRSCSLISQIKQTNQCSLFQCNDQSKCLSQHRLSDGYEDCSNGEDEHQNGTCLLNHPYRFICDNGKRCIHPSVVANKNINCIDGSDEILTMQRLCSSAYIDECRVFRREPRRFNVTFEQICNGIIELQPDFKGNTDESDCLLDEWRCHNYPTECDTVWNCPNGEDELGCGIPNLASRHCNKTTHFCLDIQTGFPKCLSIEQVDDGKIDCVGSSDERSFCRNKYPYEFIRRYQCLNSDKCISPFQVCNCQQDCPLNDDETIACHWINNGQKPWCNKNIFRCRNGKLLNDIKINFRCDGMLFHCEDGEDELFCDLIDQVFGQLVYLKEMEEYPKRLRRQASNLDSLVVWYCNRGLYVRSSEDPSGFVCLCPIYYYGYRCQFQRKRLTLIFQVQMIDSFDRNSPTIKFVVLLIRQNNLTTILSHEQFIYTPLQYCLPKYIAHLVYPINDSLSLSSNDSIQILMFTSSTVEYRASWIFPVPFRFLPVQRIAKRLFLSNSEIINPLIMSTILKRNSSFCSEDSMNVGYDVDLNRDICICPLNRIGSRCSIPFDPCNENSCNSHGQCVPSDERFLSNSQFRCVCDLQWFGNTCEKEKFRINVSFSQDIIGSSSSIVLLHMIISQKNRREATYFTSFDRLYQEIFNLTFFFEYDFVDIEFNGLVSFIQLFRDLGHFDYYLLVLLKEVNVSVTEINTEINQFSRCRSINELFNDTILSQPYLRRIKYYQRPCLKRNTLDEFPCFYDDQLICLCDQTNHINCFNLNSTLNGCPWNKCSGRGICVQNHYLCPTSSLCLCDPCSYGSICQFLSKGYILSLDAIIGSHIRPKIKNLSDQSVIVQITLIIIIILVIIAIILHIFVIGTFYSRNTKQFDCNNYLLMSSSIGLLTIIILMCKIILLLTDKQNNISCSLIEYLLKWFPTSCEWLNGCVAIERTLTVIYTTRFSRLTSKRLSKWLIIFVLISIGIISSPELYFRRMIIDRQDDRTWCVLTFDRHQSTFLTLYTVSNILLFLLPVIINLTSAIIIIFGTYRSKQRTKSPKTGNVNEQKKWREEFNTIKKHIMKHKHILIGPVLFALLSVARILFLFIFVCTKLDQRPYLSLFAYLIGFIPVMSVLFGFILPSRTYRLALLSFTKKILPKYFQK